MLAELQDIAAPLAAALAAGAVIGLERSYRGRFAGFRTHALVALASALMMLASVHAEKWFPDLSDAFDPTRVAQGIMTGIGFVGAGAIIKEGLTVRGLTTAASIWVTAVIGIVAGVGMYLAAACGTFLTLATLSVLGWIESHMTSESYVRCTVRYARDAVAGESALRELVGRHDFDVRRISYRLSGEGREFEYQLVLRTLHESNMGGLARTLREDPAVREFRLVPISE
ncbi:MAG TPA: MgtC/SapB family protein [Burkholderiales bacterium]|nr:MgtC/SapB family protein [Burkholderiales bacterium]